MADRKSIQRKTPNSKTLAFPKLNGQDSGSAAGIDNMPTLAKNFPEVLLALLKRLNTKDRELAISQFKKAHPEEFKQWYTPRTKEYLEFVRSSRASGE